MRASCGAAPTPTPTPVATRRRSSAARRSTSRLLNAGGAHGVDGARARFATARARRRRRRLGPRARRAAHAPEVQVGTTARRHDALRAAGRNAMLYFFFRRGGDRRARRAQHRRGRPRYAQLPLCTLSCRTRAVPCRRAAETTFSWAALAQWTEGGGGGPQVDGAGVVVGYERGDHALLRATLPISLIGALFPPAGAFGANTGLQDAHNLAWKIAPVHRGAAPAALLRTYDGERRAVAIANARSPCSSRTTAACVSLMHSASPPPSLARSTRRCARWRPCSSSRSPLMQAIDSPWGANLPNADGVRERRATRSSLLASGCSAVLSTLMPTARRRRRRATQRRACARRRRRGGRERRGAALLFPRHELGFAYDDASAAVTAAPPADAADADGAAPPPDPDIEDEAYAPPTAAGRASPSPLARKR